VFHERAYTVNYALSWRLECFANNVIQSLYKINHIKYIVQKRAEILTGVIHKQYEKK
jgi:hypothetical protein